MTKDELLKLIDQAAEEGWTELDLAGCKLTELPPEIGKLTQLEALILGKYDEDKRKHIGNYLKSLPLEFFQLTNLKKLGLGCNQLSSLPTAISHLQRS